LNESYVMRIIKQSKRTAAKVSLVLLDWSVRESFHLLHYLSQQTVERDTFEVIMIEYHDRVSDALMQFKDQIDTWLVLDMPKDCYYHKHYMYNAGIVLANGEIILIGDSDAMVRPTFIETVIRNFEADPEIVYHMDQFRNMRRDFYPFNYPSFEDVLGDGCINNGGGVTTGVLEKLDPIHARNYGACMCAKRDDLIAIGGADMHIDYLGHICGPYDMTFRLANYGRREVWDMKEFTYHTWHPGQAGADNYLGPHDGRHMSTTALEAISSGRVKPLLENPAIRVLREGGTRDSALRALRHDHYLLDWRIDLLKEGERQVYWGNYMRPMGLYKGFRLVAEGGQVFAFPLHEKDAETKSDKNHGALFDGYDVAEVRAKIDAAVPWSLRIASTSSRLVSLLSRAVAGFGVRAGNLPLPVPRAWRPVLLMPFVPIGLLLLAVFQTRRVRSKLAAVNSQIDGEDLVGELAVAIYNLAKWGILSHPRRSVLVVSGEAAKKSLVLLRQFGLLPDLDVRVTPTIEEFSDLVSALDRSAASCQLLVPRRVHACFYSAVVSSKIGTRCLVL
jgi:hypothetical protein